MCDTSFVALSLEILSSVTHVTQKKEYLPHARKSVKEGKEERREKISPI
jgi:hypothetical protein